VADTAPNNIEVPALSLVVLVGASGAGKSSFARKHFKPTEVLSSDRCRGMVSDDDNDLAVTGQAFELLHFIARQRLALGKLTVVDATNVQPEARKPLVALARELHCLPVAIVLAVPERVCLQRNAGRPDRQFGPHVVRQQTQQLRRSLRHLKDEGFRHVFVLETPEAVDAATIERKPMWNDKRAEHGPFDVIGDVHGCFDELRALLRKLGYEVESAAAGCRARHPAGRKAVFLGDLVDRGPNTPAVLRLVMNMVGEGAALCVPGNHDMKLMRKLRGRDVRVTHGLAESLAQLEREPDGFRASVADFIDGLVSHYVLDDGNLVVAHAGLPASMHGRGSGKVRAFALFGDTTGETDEYGLPVRYPWAQEYRGRAMVVYGHTPVPEAEWLNRTICIDTGCVFGGRLTALRYPERELVSVAAAATYYQPSRPFLPAAARAPALTAQQADDDVLDMEDVSGKRIISTRLAGNVTIREQNAIAALEVMSRFAANPRWLIHLPPTMSPCETSARPGLLEHPAEAFAYFRGQGVPAVVCEEKHMGSRAVVVVCRDEDVARRRFGVVGEGAGACVTRTGRRFFADATFETDVIARVQAAFAAADLWRRLDTDWACLDCELLPWSAKAQELLRTQYAAVGSAGTAALAAAAGALETAVARGGEPGAGAAALLARTRQRAADVGRFVDSYRRYCWEVASPADVKLAPFHLLATEGQVHVHAGKDHAWHMRIAGELCAAGGALFQATPFRVVDLADAAGEADAVAWWESLTGGGGEGMVVKPLDFVARGPRGLVQPAVKCRGPEYLRIIYGPEYLAPENLERLRARGLSHKRSLALREFALGIEALERFVRREPLRRVHECVFGVLALESEPVDPRL
jgi:polynucleotide kinase-phosphatase